MNRTCVRLGIVLLSSTPAWATPVVSPFTPPSGLSLSSVTATGQERSLAGPRSPMGTTYSVSPLICTATGQCSFQSAGPDVVTFDGIAEQLPALGTNSVVPTVTESETVNGNGTTTLVIRMTGSGELYPAGFQNQNNQPLVNIGFVIGPDAPNGNPLDQTPAYDVLTANLQFFIGQQVAGTFDLTNNAQWGGAGTWNGVGIFAFVGGVGVGVDSFTLTLTGQPVPEPATASMLVLGGILMLRRRARR